MGWITNAKAQREAKEFAASVKPGHTYYSIEKVYPSWPGPDRVLKEWVFTKASWRTGQPMCGHLTAAGVWLSAGPLYAERPRGIMTFKEWSEYEVAGPNPAEALQERAKSRAGR